MEGRLGRLLLLAAALVAVPLAALIFFDATYMLNQQRMKKKPVEVQRRAEKQETNTVRVPTK